MTSGKHGDSLPYGTTQLSIHSSHGLEIILPLLSRVVLSLFLLPFFPCFLCLSLLLLLFFGICSAVQKI